MQNCQIITEIIFQNTSKYGSGQICKNRFSSVFLFSGLSKNQAGYNLNQPKKKQIYAGSSNKALAPDANPGPGDLAALTHWTAKPVKASMPETASR